MLSLPVDITNFGVRVGAGEVVTPPHHYSGTTAIFPILKPGKLAADLRLEEEGASRGRANQPPAVQDLTIIQACLRIFPRTKPGAARHT